MRLQRHQEGRQVARFAIRQVGIRHQRARTERVRVLQPLVDPDGSQPVPQGREGWAYIALVDFAIGNVAKPTRALYVVKALASSRGTGIQGTRLQRLRIESGRLIGG